MTSEVPGGQAPIVASRSLPRWPLTATIIGYPVWWITGLGDMVFPIFAAVMVVNLIRVRKLRMLVPRGFGLWLAFMAMMTISVLAVDSFGRLVGFGFRWSLYASATVVFLYVYHARKSISARYVAGVTTGFLAIMAIGGYLGIFLPLFTMTTPLAHVLPGSLLGNDLVREMVYRRLTQFDPTAYTAGSPRPSAPFLYTNGWGFAYAVVLPVAVAYLRMIPRGPRYWLTVVTIVASLIPAFYTQNRGMFIGIGIALVFAVVRLLLVQRWRAASAVMVIAFIGALILMQSGAVDRLSERLETTESTTSRATLYADTYAETLKSPVFGYGAPRPSAVPGLPSLGTQGQVWQLMFSHGFASLFFFVGWFVVALFRAKPGQSPVHLAGTSAILAAAVLCLFYNITNITLLIVMMLAAVVTRPVVKDS